MVDKTAAIDGDIKRRLCELEDSLIEFNNFENKWEDACSTVGPGRGVLVEDWELFLFYLSVVHDFT